MATKTIIISLQRSIFKNIMIKQLRLLFIFALVISLAENVKGQATTSGANTITTAVPFLSITPDSRAGGMGDAGVGTTPDVSSQHWNPAKYAFIDNDMGVGLSYSPWFLYGEYLCVLDGWRFNIGVYRYGLYLYSEETWYCKD